MALMPSPVKRRYDATRRRQGAARTRAAILDAARQRLGDPQASRRRRRHEAAVAAEREQMNRVVDDLIRADDSEMLTMSMLRGADLQNALVDETAQVHPTAAISAGAYVGPGARIGARTTLHAGARVLDFAVVGEGCTLWSGAVVRERCVLGNRVVLQPNCVIGSDGFGFAFDLEGDGNGPMHRKVPQAGIVRVEDATIKQLQQSVRALAKELGRTKRAAA